MLLGAESLLQGICKVLCVLEVLQSHEGSHAVACCSCSGGMCLLVGLFSRKTSQS